MNIPLAAITKRVKKTRKSEIVFRPVVIPSTYASDLYASAYAPVLKAWAEVTPAIMAEYERSLSALSTDSAEDLGTRIEAAERETSAVLLRLRVALGAWAQRSEQWQRTRWRQVVLTATGVDLGTFLGPGEVQQTLGASIERNVGLVKSVSDQVRDRISTAVFQGLTKRQPAREVAAAIAEAGEMGKRRARNIASDQLTKISSELGRERRRQVGIDTWEWLHSGKAHPREEHEARDGKRYSDENAPSDLPGELINCGCTERAVLSLEGEF